MAKGADLVLAGMGFVVGGRRWWEDLEPGWKVVWGGVLYLELGY